ncbi:hypothetical protein PF005_g14400 [Phytophthora fragariae]|uniref:Uncharacterized protein n=1 Tax=Phytophthora fragariae TaxID=53985 RepID=A0A6A3RX85_9STRA|nr:hypothetical protein PF003_g25111 [Phytophthora fragariae]KAE8931563.1 hypothetical protein PF009_g18378 [Phytophthora fragariae]KAE8987437.1 hypothetical protein PF011_g19576 [Phytophthora fragariae]KAE9088154.1 hypothetical protein PF007_g20085 [Phytophthora fragariae]KAE9095112.1 hypothetical protein PF010_g16835 [Phytophthora fragariae]
MSMTYIKLLYFVLNLRTLQQTTDDDQGVRREFRELRYEAPPSKASKETAIITAISISNS